MTDLEQQFLYMISDQEERAAREESGADSDSFVVRIWKEARDRNGAVTGWRGSIAHVGSGRKLYIQELSSITRFIQEQSGIHPPQWKDRIRAWFDRFIYGIRYGRSTTPTRRNH